MAIERETMPGTEDSKNAMSCNGFDKPGSRWDYALLGAVAVASVPFIAANAVIFAHRSRRYFRAQGGALLILSSSVAGLLWIAASFVTNFHFPRNHRFLLICPLWTFWLQIVFGYWLWLVCQILRLFHLQRLCWKPGYSVSGNGRRFHILLYAFAMWIPGFAFAIAATLSHASKPNIRGSVCANCIIQLQWKYCTYTILPSIYFVILSTLLYRSRSSKDYLMELEYTHTFEYSFIMAMVIFLLMGAIGITQSRKKYAGRIFLTFCICFLVFVNFWVRLGYAVYICTFKNVSAMDNFEEELQSCGAECLNDLCSMSYDSQTRRRISSSSQYSDWILTAIGDAMDEISECKERKAQLERRKLILSTKSQQLERSMISARRL